MQILGGLHQIESSSRIKFKFVADRLIQKFTGSSFDSDAALRAVQETSFVLMR